MCLVDSWLSHCWGLDWLKVVIRTLVVFMYMGSNVSSRKSLVFKLWQEIIGIIVVVESKIVLRSIIIITAIIGSASMASTCASWVLASWIQIWIQMIGQGRAICPGRRHIVLLLNLCWGLSIIFEMCPYQLPCLVLEAFSTLDALSTMAGKLENTSANLGNDHGGWD